MMGPSLPALAASGTWTPTGSLHVARDTHTATRLPNGSAVVSGRVGHSSTLLFSGLVLNAAGANAAFELLSAETFQQ
jgi:hypothetical protein